MVTMTYIAKMCGVSRQTVSAAFNEKSKVSEKTRRRILEVAKKYNYQPNLLATTLLGKSANLIGVTILDIRNAFFAELVQGINSALRKDNYHIIFFEPRDKDEEVDAIETLLAYQVAGMIISPIQVESRIEHFQALVYRKEPFVTIGPIRGMESNYVEVDNYAVSYLATEYLVKLGHRNICYLEGPETIISARERTMGFIMCLRENRVLFNDSTVIKAGSSTKEGYDAAMRILREKKQRPTAVACFNDIVAIGVYEAAKDLGLRIPEDLSVIGCDNIEITSLLGPPLTTISLPVFEMGKKAAEILLRLLRRKGEEGYLVKRFSPILIERASVKSLV